MPEVSSTVTLKDVARQCGLSSSTVSRILNKSKATGFSAMEGTRSRVETTAVAMGYRLNHAAKATATGRFGCIAVLMSTYAGRSIYSPQLLDGVQESLASHNMHLIVGAA